MKATSSITRTKTKSCGVETSSAGFTGTRRTLPGRQAGHVGQAAACLPRAGAPRSAEVYLVAAGAPSDAHLTQFRLRHVVTFLSNRSTRPTEV